MSRETIAKNILDQAERSWYEHLRKGNISNKAFNDLKLGTGLMFNLAELFTKSKTGKVLLFVENGIVKGMVDTANGESAIKQAIGIAADMALFCVTKNAFGIFISAALNIARIDPSTGYKAVYDLIFDTDEDKIKKILENIANQIGVKSISIKTILCPLLQTKVIPMPAHLQDIAE